MLLAQLPPLVMVLLANVAAIFISVRVIGLRGRLMDFEVESRCMAIAVASFGAFTLIVAPRGDGYGI
jgi:hypothetical protein